MVNTSFNYRVNFNGRDYDVLSYNNGTFELIDTMNPSKRRQVTAA